MMRFESEKWTIGDYTRTIFFILMVGFMFAFFYSEITREVVKHDTIISENIEVTYFDSTIDTLTVERNEMVGYSLVHGDLSTSTDWFGERKPWIRSYVIKSGVRDYKILE